MKIIDTTNLPFLLQTLKEKNDSKIIPMQKDISNLITSNNNNVEIINCLVNDSGIDIIPVKSDTDVTGYQFDLYSNITSEESSNKTIIASGVLPYDTISNNDSIEIINEVNVKIQ